MSISTDAYLFYGLCWDYEDHFWPWQLDDEGFPLGDYEDAWDWADAHPEAGVATYTNDGPLMIGTHCSTGCRMGYVAVSSTKIRAARGYPEKVTSLAIPEGAEEQLRAFCAAAGYDFAALVEEGRLGWWLCSDTDAF